MSIFNVFCRGLTRENALQISFDRLLNNVVSNPYKTLRKVRLKNPEKPGKNPGIAVCYTKKGCRYKNARCRFNQRVCKKNGHFFICTSI
jgi:hypothetical protein